MLPYCAFTCIVLFAFFFEWKSIFVFITLFNFMGPHIESVCTCTCIQGFHDKHVLNQIFFMPLGFILYTLRSLLEIYLLSWVYDGRNIPLIILEIHTLCYMYFTYCISESTLTYLVCVIESGLLAFHFYILLSICIVKFEPQK